MLKYDLKSCLKIVLFSILYFVIGHYALKFSVLFNFAAPVWPPAGIASFAIFMEPWLWPGILIGQFSLQFYNGWAWWQALLAGFGNVIEALAFAWVFKQALNWNQRFDFLTEAWSVILAAMVGSFLSAVVGASVLMNFGAEFSETFYIWMFGNILGHLLVFPTARLIKSDINNHVKYGLEQSFLFLASTAFIALYSKSLHWQIVLILPFIVIGIINFKSKLNPFLFVFGQVVALLWCHLNNVGPFEHFNDKIALNNLQLYFAGLIFFNLLLNSLRESSHNRKVLIISYINLGLLMLGMSYFYAVNEKEDFESIQKIVERTNIKMQESDEIYTNVLRASSAYVNQSKSKMTQSLWDDYVRNSSFLEHNLGISGLGYISLNSQNLGDLVIAPSELNERINIADFISIPELKKALMISRDTGIAILSDQFSLNINGKNEDVLMYLYPVYRSHYLPVSIDERRQQIQGWVFAPLFPDFFFREIISDDISKQLNVHIFAGMQLKDKKLLFETDKAVDVEHDRVVARGAISGLLLSFQWDRKQGFLTHHGMSYGLLFFTGIIIIALIALYLVNLENVNFKASQLALKMTQELNQTQERFKNIYFKSSDGIIIFDDEKTISVNPAFVRIMGLSNEDSLLKLHFSDLILKGSNIDGQSLFKKIKERGKGNAIFRIKNFKENEIIIKFSLSRYMQDQKVIYIGTLSDITEEKEIEKRLIQAKHFAEETAKAKSNFLSTMSHEIRTPLNGILGIVNLLQENPREDQRENINILKFSAENLLHIVNEILDISKIDAGKMSLDNKAVDFPYWFDHSISLYTAKAKEKNINLIIDRDERIPSFIELDELRNTQILTNLINNAIKFTTHGEIKVKAELVDKNDDQVKLRFSVKDTGIGIAEDKLSTVFEAFSQAEGDHARKFGGTGLGLAITKKLIELQNGEIKIASKVNQGTEFFYELTFKIGSVCPIKLSTEMLIEENAGPCHVLIVDDNPINSTVARKFLEKWGHTSVSALSGQEAIDLMMSQHFDLVLMDLHMPEMSGFEATKFIRSFNLDTPIYALSADVIGDVKNEVISVGMNGYLAKPFRPNELKAIIQKSKIKKAA